MWCVLSFIVKTFWYSNPMDFSIESLNDLQNARKKKQRRFFLILAALLLISILFLFGEIFVGSSSMTFQESFLALFGQGKASHIKIMQNIRLPRAIGGFLVGAGLAIAGLLMQTSLQNPMASPGTLGISNAAVLGANVAIILLSDNPVNGTVWNNPSPYGVAGVAFLAALISTAIVLLLGSLKHFSPVTIILIGVGLSAGYQAITTLIQYFAADNTLASAVYWSFGDIGRINPQDNILLLIVLLIGMVVFMLFSSRYDALLLDEKSASSLGVKVPLLRLMALFIASLITASIVSLCGIIGFIGIVAPHICRRIVGNSHKHLIPSSLLMGSILILGSDLLGRSIASGTSLPVGALTALFGAPLFIFIVIRRKEVSL